MRILIATGFLLVASLLQSLVGDNMAFGSRPDFALVVVLAWAMLRGSSEGAIVGFVGGLLLDSVSYTQFGLSGALLGLVGYLVGLPEANAYRGNFPFFLATAAVVTLLYHTAMFLLLQALGQVLPPVPTIYRVVGPAALYNVVLLAPTFLVCRRVLRTMDGWQQMQL